MANNSVHSSPTSPSPPTGLPSPAAAVTTSGAATFTNTSPLSNPSSPRTSSRRVSTAAGEYVHRVGQQRRGTLTASRRMSINSNSGHPSSSLHSLTSSSLGSLSRSGRTPSEIMAGIPPPAALPTATVRKVAGWIDWDKNTRSNNYHGSGSYATFMIIGPTCFFLGMLFSMFPYDFPLLWSSKPIPANYYDHLETHLRFMHDAPALISRILHIASFICFAGFFIKLYRPSSANALFDGAGLVLYVIGVCIFITNINTGLRSAAAGTWNADDFRGSVDRVRPGIKAAVDAGEVVGVAAAAAGSETHGLGPRSPVHVGPFSGKIVMDRESSMKVLAASNTILALVLVGVLVLQSGQWYAERKDLEELETVDKMERERRDRDSPRAKKKI